MTDLAGAGARVGDLAGAGLAGAGVRVAAGSLGHGVHAGPAPGLARRPPLGRAVVTQLPKDFLKLLWGAIPSWISAFLENVSKKYSFFINNNIF